MDDSTFDAKRRSLLAISIVLCFFKYADASFLPSATISSLSLTVGRPEAIAHLLWLMWAYFYVRAYQHYHYHISSEYKRSIQKTLIPLLHRQIAHLGIPEEHERYFFEDLERFHKYELKLQWSKFFQLVLAAPRVILLFLALPVLWVTHRVIRSRSRRSRPLLNLLRDKRIMIPHWIGVDILPWSIRVWSVSDRPADAPGKMDIGVSLEEPVPFLLGLSLYGRILLKLTFFSAPFFDYRLPFILALLPLAFWGFA